jgi:8-oxo-dGTP diphosphatase
MKYKLSACVIVPDGYGRFLAVSRGKGSSQWGFPGGKVNPGESFVTAAARELREETGVVAHCLSRVCAASPEGEYWCVCYVAEEWTGEPRPSPEGEVAWVDAATLVTMSPFADYNARALAALP